jgi:hypothetical protein
MGLFVELFIFFYFFLLSHLLRPEEKIKLEHLLCSLAFLYFFIICFDELTPEFLFSLSIFFLQYAAFRPRPFFNAVCKLCALFSTALMVLGLVLIWILYPKPFNYNEALSKSVYFYSTQKLGVLPRNYPVPWRKGESFSVVSGLVVPGGCFHVLRKRGKII